MWETWQSRTSLSKQKKWLSYQPGQTQSDPDTPKSAKSLPLLESSVQFKDVTLRTIGNNGNDHDEEDQDDDVGIQDFGSSSNYQDAECTASVTRSQKSITKVEKNQLIIILVGLPGRGKTYLCNKMMSYLNWLGHKTMHFNVGNYRRKQKDGSACQDAEFFNKDNQAGMDKRQQALMAALDDLMFNVNAGRCQVAILDATNSTQERRNQLRAHFHNRFQYLFIESVCNDNRVMEDNIRNKMKYSPDYQGVDEETALKDFHDRIKNYQEVYETITDRSLHYIKLIDMVTGRGHMDVNRISGYLPGKIVFFLMQVCKAGLGLKRKIFLTRHGESVYNTTGQLGGDSNLTEMGKQYAQVLPDFVMERLQETIETDDDTFPQMSVWTSTLQRTIHTAKNFPTYYPKVKWKALDEINAGIFETWTYSQIEQSRPQEFAARKANKLGYRYPSGESYLDVIQRLEPVIIEMERERESICIVAHQAILRVIYAYFMKIPLEKLPSLDIPLHTIIELTPYPDGQMQENFIVAPVSAQHPNMSMVFGKDSTASSGDIQDALVQVAQLQIGNEPSNEAVTSFTNFCKLSKHRDVISVCEELEQESKSSQAGAEAPSVSSSCNIADKGGSQTAPSSVNSALSLKNWYDTYQVTSTLSKECNSEQQPAPTL